VPIDPLVPVPVTEPAARAADRLGALERRVSRLERSNPIIHSGAAAPTVAVRDGAPYVSTSTPRLWIRVGGVWRYVTLT
jgi:hypothetical protein